MLITRCSACSTEFRVTEPQLTARNGWVRCGQCMAVFDARRTLVEPAADYAGRALPPSPGSAGPADKPGAGAEKLGSPPAQSETAEATSATSRDREPRIAYESGPNLDISAGSGIDLLASSALEPEHKAPSHVPATNSAASGGRPGFIVPAQETSHEDPETGSFPEHPTAARPDPVFAEAPSLDAIPNPPAPLARANAGNANASETGIHHDDPTPASADESFAGAPDEIRAEPHILIAPETAPAANARPVAAARAPKESALATAQADAELLDFGRMPRKRRTALWVGGSAVLLLALGAQAAFEYRSTIALLLPETKPYLEELCAGLGCELPLQRRTELLSIETSDLQGHPNNPGVMVLAATLRNRAPFPQAYPALELTLTDDRDQPLARRMLQPSDYLGQSTARPEVRVFAPSSEQPMRVFLEAAALKATGYRLYLFHP